MTSSDLFKHVYIDNNQEKILFLLHGTGGNEYDLLPLVSPLENKYNFLGLRGNINENGLNRWFERKGEGVFVKESIDEEAEKLSEFINQWKGEKAFLGFSNGANMILSMLFLYPNLINKAVILHPMLPFSPSPNVSLSGTELFVSYGTREDLTPTDSEAGIEVVNILESLGANVKVFTHTGGHEITQREIKEVVNFLL